jgi:hypothetical protein
MVEYAGLVGLLCCTGIFTAARKGPQFWGTILGMLVVSSMYGWGLAATLDTMLDRSTPTNYTSTVLNKYESHGRGTTYYLDLAPWGPIQEPDGLRVSSSTYGGTSIGEWVCLQLRPGMLHVQWYRIVECPKETGQ